LKWLVLQQFGVLSSPVLGYITDGPLWCVILLYEDFVGYIGGFKFRIKDKFTYIFNFKRKVCKAFYLRPHAEKNSNIKRT